MAQVYVGGIVFGATINARAIEFSEEMKKEFDDNKLELVICNLGV